MRQEFAMVVSETSNSSFNTPGQSTQRLPFYVESSGYMHAYGGYFTDREGLDNYLLIYTISGRGYLKYKGAEYYIEPNQAVIFYCNEHQLYKTASADGFWEFKWMHINGSAVREYYQRINGEGINVVSIDPGSDIGLRFGIVYDYFKKGEMLSDVRACSVIDGILTEIIVCRNSELNNRNYRQHKREIEKAVQYIQQNYRNKIGIDDITKQVLISKYHFLRIFKEYSGMSPYEYLINYRITNAKRLLKDTELSISEICTSVGFSDTNNFIRYFKSLTGVTPGKFRCYRID